MIDTSSYKAALNLFIKRLYCNENQFEWSDFKFASTLKLNIYLEQLLEPVLNYEIKEKLKLGLHEALVNSVSHGNSVDSSKYIRVRRIITPNWFIWQIQDQGSGIPIQARQSSLPKNIQAVSGRGLFLIHHSFDDVRWNNKGNRIQLACKRN